MDTHSEKMRTTVSLETPVAQWAKDKSDRECRSVSSVIRELIMEAYYARLGLAVENGQRNKPPITRHVGVEEYGCAPEN